MDNQDMERAAKSLAALFSCFPQSALADIDMQMRGYLEALKSYEIVDVQSAIKRFIQGEAKTENPQFCPSSAQLCIETRLMASVRVITEKKQAQLKIVKS